MNYNKFQKLKNSILSNNTKSSTSFDSHGRFWNREKYEVEPGKRNSNERDINILGLRRGLENSINRVNNPTKQNVDEKESKRLYGAQLNSSLNPSFNSQASSSLQNLENHNNKNANLYNSNLASKNPYEDQSSDSPKKTYSDSMDLNIGKDSQQNLAPQAESRQTTLPELVKIEPKYSRFPNPSENGRLIRNNRSVDLNSYELAKMFDCFKRRDPILCQIKLPESEYSNFEERQRKGLEDKSSTAQEIREMHQIHSKTFTDHHLQWKNKYPKPFK